MKQLKKNLPLKIKTNWKARILKKKKKKPAAVALGRLGGLKGGKARAKKPTKKQRQEIARKPLKLDGKNVQNRISKFFHKFQ